MTHTLTDWIMTASGRQFYPLAPRAEDVCIDDIAHHLAACNRFAGATTVPYSVAQHSVLVSVEMERCASADLVAQWGLYGLLHDGSEFALGDIPRPLKRRDAYAAYREAEARLMAVIYQVFGLLPHEPATLAVVDRRMLRTEQAQLMPPAAPGEVRTDVPVFDLRIEPWGFYRARGEFLARFHTLAK